MFRQMRRFRQQLQTEFCEEILNRCGTGVLAVSGDEGYPYAVPLNYVYFGGKLYFHCAKTGHKLDAIARCDKVSFCVIDHDEVLPEKLTTLFRSVIVFGRARVVTDEAEKRTAICCLGKKFAPELSTARIDAEIEGDWKSLCIVCIEIENMTGKECIEFVRERTEK